VRLGALRPIAASCAGAWYSTLPDMSLTRAKAGFVLISHAMSSIARVLDFRAVIMSIRLSTSAARVGLSVAGVRYETDRVDRHHLSSCKRPEAIDEGPRRYSAIRSQLGDLFRGGPTCKLSNLAL
jgi:hypothetical protein